MKFTVTQRWKVMLVLFIALSLLSWPAGYSVQAAQVARMSFRGDAVVVKAVVAGVNILLANTGRLPSTGGERSRSVESVRIPNVLSGAVLRARTYTENGAVYSYAAINRLAIGVGDQSIAAAAIRSNASASCSPNGVAIVRARAVIDRLTINGSPVIAAGTPNQTIDIPNGKVILNKQIKTGSGRSADITVYGAQITINGLADIIIASSHAGITCN